MYISTAKYHDGFVAKLIAENWVFNDNVVKGTSRLLLPMVVIVFNNGGVYGGDRRSPEEVTPLKDDPAPTTFIPGAAYHTLMEACGGKGYLVGTRGELKSGRSESFSTRKPAIINVIIDPFAGAESGRMQHKN
ncbi:2-hydroxyacyl-CoA lyase-like [Durio zibethinus]|uniref:2-hydroxyacyl-CoA lyase-like n=1 Tax=Durio zibethinus TaxID=66656 RepID=A0A6P6AHB6_DURZI|nr:2-hydroxyacyl-CoA lyase-like [Durio zibethinus]